MNRSSNRNDVLKCFDLYYQKLKNYSFESKKLLKTAIEKDVWPLVFRDFSPRTLTVRKPEDGGITIEEFRKKAIDFLSLNYSRYFSENPLAYYEYDELTKAIPCADFEQWHQNMCESLLRLINARYCDRKENTKNLVAVSYGKAQKIINMMFKYLYCFDCADRYLEKFQNCHMTIDAVIIDWFADVALPALSGKSEKFLNSGTIKWSKAFHRGSMTEPNTYLWYQKQIKQFLKISYLDQDGQKLTPFLAEFYAWPEEQWLKATKAWLSLDVNRTDYPAYDDKNLADYAQRISECICKRSMAELL
ncbi:MAG: hypothetical protein IJO28_06465 [Oscillospiraceae bacterium]|nr:hypothetical protein [Oscillospiraceae bacterium]